MVLVENFKFLHPFFMAEIGWEKVFADVLGRKLAFLDYESIDKEKRHKICIFPKVHGPKVHGFGRKFQISSFFLFRQIQLRKSV